MADTTTNKRIQFKDKSNNKLYPEILGANIPDGGVATAKIADKAVTTAKLEASLQTKLNAMATSSDYSTLKATVDKLDGTASTDGSVKKQIADAISGVTQFEVSVVTALPTTGVKGVIYLIAHTHSSSDSNVSSSAKESYDEYIWLPSSSTFEKIGSTDIDISGKADKATTLSGYGITNAYTKTEANNTFLGKTAKAASATTADSATTATTATNATKVNNHTVEADVPSGAKFTDTVYDDSSVTSRLTTLENAQILYEEVTA